MKFAKTAPYIALILSPVLLLWRTFFLGLPFVPSALLNDFYPWKGSSPVVWDPLMWDGMAEFYPWRLFASQTLRHGFLPFWNPHQFCGTPFMANSQSAVFYPPNLIFVLLPVSTAFGVSVFFHLVLTGSFLYVYLRSDAARLSRSAALIGALTWQLCNWQVSWLALPTFLCVSCWLPLALICVDRILSKPSPARTSALGGVLGVMLLAGHLQIALYCLLLTAAYALFRILLLKRQGAAPDNRILIVCAAVAAALMFAIAAPQLLPSVELSHFSHRAGAPSTIAAYIGYNHLSVPPYQLISLIAPGFFGSPGDGGLASYWGYTNYAENACYLGIVGLILALGVSALAIWRIGGSSSNRSIIIFYFAVALVALLMACGTPLNAILFFLIPGFKQSGSPGRILVLWSFCGAVLAGFGAEALWSVVAGKAAKCIKHAGLHSGAAIVAVLAIGALSLTHLRSFSFLLYVLSLFGTQFRIPAGLALCFAVLVWFAWNGRVSPAVFRGLLVLLVGLDLFTATLNLNTLLSPRVYPRTALIDYLIQNTGDERIMPVNVHWSLDPNRPPRAVLPPNVATVYGLDDVQGYDSLQTGQYFQYVQSLNEGAAAPQENGNMVFTYGFNSPLVREAAVKYVVSDVPLAAGEGLELETVLDNCYVYANKETLPKYWMPAGYVRKVDEISPNHLKLTVVQQGGSNRLMMADQMYPGWHARINGNPVPIDPEPDVFRMITWTVPAGATGKVATLDVRYEPMSIRFGLYLAFVALLAIAAILAAHASASFSKQQKLADPS